MCIVIDVENQKSFVYPDVISPRDSYEDEKLESSQREMAEFAECMEEFIKLRKLLSTNGVRIFSKGGNYGNIRYKEHVFGPDSELHNFMNKIRNEISVICREAGKYPELKELIEKNTKHKL